MHLLIHFTDRSFAVTRYQTLFLRCLKLGEAYRGWLQWVWKVPLEKIWWRYIKQHVDFYNAQLVWGWGRWMLGWNLKHSFVCVVGAFRASGTICCRSLNTRSQVCSKNIKYFYEWRLADRGGSREMTLEK